MLFVSETFHIHTQRLGKGDSPISPKRSSPRGEISTNTVRFSMVGVIEHTYLPMYFTIPVDPSHNLKGRRTPTFSLDVFSRGDESSGDAVTVLKEVDHVVGLHEIHVCFEVTFHKGMQLIQKR